MSKEYKDKQLKNEINSSFQSFKPVINAGHINHIKGWAFDRQGRYLLIRKHGNWYTYLPDGKQYGYPVESQNEAMRNVNNLQNKQKRSQSQEIQKKAIQEVIQNIDQSEENIKGLTEEEISNRQSEKETYEDIYEEAVLEDKSPIEIVKERREEGKISPELFTKMMAIFGKKSRLINEAEIVESNEEKRKSILDALKKPQYEREAQDKAELEILSDETIGSPKLAEKMEIIKEKFPELVNDVTLPMLQRMALDGVFDEVIKGSRSMGDLIKSESEQLVSSRPTWEQSKNIFQNEYKPNMAYPQLSPYRNEVSDVAASGQAAGSTGFENARNAEQRAITREDFDFNRDLYRTMQEDWQNRGKGIDMLAKGAKHYQDTLLGPAQERQESWQQGADKEKQNQFKQDQLNMGTAEGELKNELIDMQNEITLNDRLNVEDDSTYQWIKNLSNEMHQLKEYKEGRAILNEERKLELMQFEQALWLQRAQIEGLLRRMNNEEAAIALSQEKTKESWTEKALKYLPAVLTVAGGIGGGIVGGASGGSKNIASGAIQGASLGGTIGSSIRGEPADYSKIPSGPIFQQPNLKYGEG